MSNTKITATPLPEELVEALKEKELESFALLHVTEQSNPKDVVKNIREYVDTLLAGNHSEANLKEYALQLGTLWALMVIKEYNWQWQYLDFGEEGSGIYIVSPKTYYSCPPLYFLTKILLGNNPGPGGENDNTVMLLFNMFDGIENQVPAENYRVVS